MERPFPAYKGDEPYVFVSYAHDDAAVVYPELARLKSQGFNIWYDEGIDPGSSWRDEIALSLSQCSVLLFFVSPRSVVSENCQQELNFALSRERKVLCVNLEAAALPPGLELSLSTKQAIVRDDYAREAYEAKLQASLRELVPASSPLLSVKEPLAARDDAESIAILPLVNRSSDPENEYLSDGITDELIRGLSEVDGLRVASQLSSSAYKGRQGNVQQIGRDLTVGNVLSGSVQKAGSRVRVTVALNRVDDGTTLWSERYDRDFDDIFEVQDDVARRVVDALRIELGAGRQVVFETGTRNPAAYNAYLLGMFEGRRDTARSYRNAVRHFNEAIRLDDRYKEAYVQLLMAYLALARRDRTNPAVDRAAMKAAEARLDALDPRRALPRRYRLDTLLRNFYEPSDSEAALQYRAVEQAARVIRQRDAYEDEYVSEALYSLGMYCRSAGLYRANLEICDPERFASRPQHQVLYFRANCHAALGDFETAIGLCARAIELEPSLVAARADHVIYLARTGQYQAAAADLQTLNAAWGPRHFPAFCFQFWRGEMDAAAECAEWLAGRSAYQCYYKSAAAMMLGDVAKGLEFLEEGVAARDAFLTGTRWLNATYLSRSLLDALDAEPRYRAVLAANGIDDAFQSTLIDTVNGVSDLTGIVIRRDAEY